MIAAEALRGRYETILRLAPLLQGALRLSDLLEIIAREVSAMLEAERCSIFLIDEERGELWTPVAQGLMGRELRVPVGRGIVGAVASCRAPLIIPDAYADARFDPSFDRATGYRTCSILGVPLRDRDGAIFGVFEVLNKRRGCFDDGDVEALGAVGALAASAIENARLYESLRDAYLETAQRLARVAEYRDAEDTGPHLRRISRYSRILALAANLPVERAEAVECASPLHDIGKVAVADAILRKTGKLETAESELMKEHPLIGWKMLSRSKSPLLRLAADIALTHHERFDGSGYPKGLRGDDIPFEGQLVAVADVFDALTSRRVYKKAWSFDEACAHIREQAGKEFHPAAAAALEIGRAELFTAYRETNPDAR